MALYTKSGEETSNVMMPSGGSSGVLDIVNDFTWTISNNKAEVPVAYVTEYQINSGQLLAGLYYYGRQAINTFQESELSWGQIERGLGAVRDPYEFMYFATPTGFNYAFPWLSTDKFTRSNEFATGSTGLKEIGQHAIGYGNNNKGGKKNKSKSSSKWGAMVNTATSGIRALGELAVGGSLAGGLISKAIVGNIGLNSSKSWTGTAGQDYTVSFDLINTFNNTDEIRKNRELAFLLTYQNSPFRRNVAVIDPVCIYQLSIPDVVHFPACYISNLAINNLGNVRSLELDGEIRSIPEGYSFSLTFSSLIEESRNIFAGVDKSKDRVRAISDQRAWNAIMTGTEKGLKTAAEKIKDGAEAVAKELF